MFIMCISLVSDYGDRNDHYKLKNMLKMLINFIYFN